MTHSRAKTDYMKCVNLYITQDGLDSIRLDGLEPRRVDAFRHLESTISSDGCKEREILVTIQAGWGSWRWVSGAVCDRKMPIKLKGIVYKAVLSPAVMYGAGPLPVKNLHDRKLK